ncbi:TetR/AcrR family transcriptional regulator [Aeromicrobium sp. Root495]|uniref:TetR/AcrR family transcriptional regulator n=1 Tax=Aeromicrobium sp. Root495 TaxID=1736550 RepID=UPI0009E6BB66|nr:TetR/AcrR family transcriptional regulator [Aeromicrobium sp. Root495]
MTRDEQILAAAEALFFERSFDGVGVDEIGRAAGISGSAIYGYFDSKAEILSSLFDKILDTLLRRMGEVDDDPRRELERIVRSFVELTVESEALAAIWVREQRSLTADDRRRHERRLRHVSERWSTCLDRCYPGHTADELTTVARGLQLMLMSESLRPSTGRHAKDPEELLVAMALASLQALEGRSSAQTPLANGTSAASKASAASSIG